jgi:hypothetical protein
MTFCVASELVFVVVSVYFVMTWSGNFWIHPRIRMCGFVPPFPHVFIAWYLVKNRGNFTVT